MQTAPIVTHVRVSTSCQGRSGLGIEAQRQTLGQLAKAEGFKVVREFVEVETGKGADALDRRLQLKAALAAARKLKCHVAVANRPPQPRRSFHLGSDGSQGAVPGRRAWV
jgi:DNA invertase Pin-like site-specific DNA recombinase